MKAFKIASSILLVVILFPLAVFAQIKAPLSKDYTTAPGPNRSRIGEITPDSPVLPKSTNRRVDKDLFEAFNPEQKARFEPIQKSLREMIKATEGGVAGGGGNEKEADFISLARILLQHLSSNEKKSSEALGFDLAEYKEAVETTEVHCTADSSLLSLMRELKKAAYFTTQPERINLDCERYEALKKNGDLGPLTVFHEYMRAIGKDTSAYEASSKLMLTFYDMNIVKSDLLVDTGISKCWQKFKNARPENPPSGFSLAIDLEIGRAIGTCLFSEGLTQKVNPQVTSAQIIRYLASISSNSSENLSQFSKAVVSVLKRP